ncbi:MAG: hypothetical protein AW09_003183 [Candidatus Accumulibacter phosphatis]|jgi:hypothetical protein|uniref:Uncharacterized protein n=1 Tax=Candidatus Accumulibacter phosphatis TaxID=327160 RepID=A0A080LTD5_9PROT|nr:MAG: hypothetical protein AW09_003183 [Candidatus Accumulibacter phosphatis]
MALLQNHLDMRKLRGDNCTFGLIVGSEHTVACSKPTRVRTKACDGFCTGISWVSGIAELKDHFTNIES